MNTEITDSLNAIHDVSAQESRIICNGWMCAAIIELLIILFLVWLLAKRSQKQRMPHNKLDKLMNEKVDYQNVINSSFHAAALYDQLIKKCHPDRFPNDESKRKIAEEISAELGKSRHNVKRLDELKQRAIQELGIIL
jgi:hypothetical protein